MFFRKPTRLFTVHGTIHDHRFDDDDPRRRARGSVTLRAKTHDAAEEEAREGIREGDEWFSYRYFTVARVVEHRGR